MKTILTAAVLTAAFAAPSFAQSTTQQIQPNTSYNNVRPDQPQTRGPANATSPKGVYPNSTTYDPVQLPKKSQEKARHQNGDH